MTAGEMASDRPAFAVLVAEADDLQLQLVDVLLSDPRFHLARAASARAALEYLKVNTPDLIIAAADLPDLDGYALVSRVKRVVRLAHVPVILTTEADAGLGLSQRTRRRAEEAQVDLLLPRPLGDKNLKERALRLLQQGGSGRKRADQPRLATTLVLEEALERLPLPPPHPTRPAAPGSSDVVAGGAAAQPNAAQAQVAQAHLARAERESLIRENEALRNENRELRASIERLRRELNEARQVGRPGKR